MANTIPFNSRTTSQDVTAKLDYAEDWSNLISDGDTISQSSWSVAPAGLLLTDPIISGGLTSVWISGGTVGVAYRVTNSVVTAAGRKDVRSFTIDIEDITAVKADSLFDKALIVPEIRETRLSMIPASYLNDPVALTDDYIYAKVIAAEREVSRKLTIPLSPVEVFSSAPTAEELLALNGAPYVIEPGYDMPPEYFSSQSWGALRLRMRPVIAVHEVKMVYPSMVDSQFVVPSGWIRVDNKYGLINIFPSGPAQNAPLSIFMMQAMGAGYTVPLMIRVKYRAGINAALAEYADVLDLVKRVAMLHILIDSYLPQSGSISADGLSQSVSMDTSKISDSIDDDIAALKQSLLGPVWGVL